jgi:plasmid segregation protein ParM
MMANAYYKLISAFDKKNNQEPIDKDKEKKALKS